MIGAAIRQLAKTISYRAMQKSGSYFIAVDGRSGAGKSTLAVELAKLLDASVVEGDDFFAGGVDLLDITAGDLAEICIDWRRQAELLQTLKSQNVAEYFPFDWEAFDGTKSEVSKQVRSRRIVIVEGVYSARPELRHLIDFSICIDLPEHLRMRRLLEREGEIGPWELQWHRAEDWYFENQAKIEDFDAVLTWHDNQTCNLLMR